LHGRATVDTHEYAERDRELGERREASRRGIPFLKPRPARMTYPQGRHSVREREELGLVQRRPERCTGHTGPPVTIWGEQHERDERDRLQLVAGVEPKGDPECRGRENLERQAAPIGRYARNESTVNRLGYGPVDEF
jgi:hypothetical protein